MKEVPLSNCERSFIADVISNKQRLDGRDLDSFRPLKINFGADWGSVHVALGETRVLAQVTCSVVQPKATRPNEGQLFLKLELGPMAGPQFEANRQQSDQAVQINRILERAFKDSNCIDLESLCIVSDEKVWQLKVDLSVLNNEGNLIDCASVAVMAALAHFRRPDFTNDGDQITIHKLHERDPIATSIHHYPVCVSYAIFSNGATAIADPTALEERCAEAHLVFGLNSYRELCGLHFGGVTMASSQLLLKCATRGANHARKVVDQIRAALKADQALRDRNERVSFTECVRLQRITSSAQDRLAIRLKRFTLRDGERALDDEEEPDDDEPQPMAVDGAPQETSIVSIDAKSAALVPQSSKWLPESDFENSDPEDDDNYEQDEVVELSKAQTIALAKQAAKAAKKPSAAIAHIVDSDSEEESTVVMRTIDQ